MRYFPAILEGYARLKLGARMPEYRLYRLDDKGRIVGTEVIVADDDESAIVAIRELKEPKWCELWQRGRRVAAIPPFGTAKDSTPSAQIWSASQ